MGVMSTEEHVNPLEQGEVTDQDPDLFPEGWTTDVTQAGGGPVDPSKVAAANEIIAGASSAAEEDVPLIATPPDTLVRLPGGLVVDGEVYRDATVRELNGEDEEHLARAILGNNAARYIQALLERGVVEVGPVKVTTKVLDSLLVGDRDALMLGIRIVTFGDELEMEIACPSCLITADIKVMLREEVPVKPLPWEAYQTYHEVPLRNGVAVVRLATGADWRFLNGLENKTMAELNTVLMARCVQSINGVSVNGQQSPVRALGQKDRSLIIDWMADNQPGPQYDEVVWTCPSCAKEVPISLAPADLFQG